MSGGFGKDKDQLLRIGRECVGLVELIGQRKGNLRTDPEGLAVRGNPQAVSRRIVMAGSVDGKQSTDRCDDQQQKSKQYFFHDMGSLWYNHGIVL